MYCLNCGAKLAENVKFCHACGTPVQQGTSPPLTRAVPVAGESAPRAVPRRWLGCGAALLGILLLIALVLAAAYFLLGLHRDSGITELAPADATSVVVIRPSVRQLNQLRDTERVLGSVATLAPLAAAPGVTDFVFDLYNDYGPALQNVAIDPVEDVLPWIGREVALAASGPNEDVVAAAAVRNEARAVAFLAGLREQLEREGITFDESNHNGVAITEVTGPDFYTPLAFAVNDERLLLASNRQALQDALDRAENGGATLAGNEAFHDALAAQPGDRLAAVYINPAALGGGTELLTALRWVSGAATLTGNGTRVNYRLGFDRDAFDADQREWLEQGGIDNRLAARIPDDALLYLAGGSLAAALDNAAQLPDFENALEEIQADGDLSGLYNLLEMMTGEFALAVTSDNEGLLAELSGEPFGLLIAAQVEDSDDALAELEDVFEDISRETDSSYETDESADGVAGYLENEFISGGPFLGYGVTGDEMWLATSDALVDDALAAEGGLGDEPRFRATIDALPGGGLLYLYSEFDEIRDLGADLLGVSEETLDEYTERIEAIGLAVEPLERNGEMNLEIFFLTESPGR
jgi:hypothetical protein